MHIQEDGSLPKLNPEEGFDLEPYETSLRQLAVDEDCTVNQVAALPFADVPYHLGYHCDGCLLQRSLHVRFGRTSRHLARPRISPIPRSGFWSSMASAGCRNLPK